MKARRQGRREDVKWHEYALVVGTRNTNQIINVLDIVSEGGHDGTSTDKRGCDALTQVKARGEDGRANHEATPNEIHRDN